MMTRMMTTMNMTRGVTVSWRAGEVMLVMVAWLQRLAELAGVECR